MTSIHALEALCARAANDDDVELVVDLSNVCRSLLISDSSPEVSWERLLVALDAWNRWEFGFERPTVRLVADESLSSLLLPDDRRALRDAISDGYAEQHAYADPRILDLAEAQVCAVLSNDQFVGHRRDRPWLDGNARQFVKIVPGPSGFELSLEPLSPRSSYSVSQAEELDEMKDRRIDLRKQRGTRLLESMYRCDNRECQRRAFMADHATMPPKRGDEGAAVCPSCEAPLTNLGSRVDVAIAKLLPIKGGNDARLPIQRGDALSIGRKSAQVSLSSVLEASALPRISREHVELTFDGSSLFVVDRGSTNGTTWERWNPEVRRRDPAISLRPGARHRLGPRDRLVLGGVLAIERSGRRYPFDLGAASISVEPSSPSTVLE